MVTMMLCLKNLKETLQQGMFSLQSTDEKLSMLNKVQENPKYNLDQLIAKEILNKQKEEDDDA